MKEFFAMGGYGFFVWLSYAVALGGLFALYLFTNGCERRVNKQLEKRLRLEERRKSRETTS